MSLSSGWGRLVASAHALLRDVADAAFDPRCAAGDHPLGSLIGPACPPCLARLAGEGARPRCPSCSGSGTAAGEPCLPCTVRERTVRVLVPREHQGVARALVLAMKAARREDAAATLARATFEDAAVRAEMSLADVVVPVPAHPVRRRERGFNPAEALARELALLAGRARGRRLPMRDALRARASEGKQSSRSAARRRRALRGVLRPRLLARWMVGGRRVVLVDDVVTTGATAAESARMLHRAGAARVSVVACTRAPGEIADAPRPRSRR